MKGITKSQGGDGIKEKRIFKLDKEDHSALALEIRKCQVS